MSARLAGPVILLAMALSGGCKDVCHDVDGTCVALSITADGSKFPSGLPPEFDRIDIRLSGAASSQRSTSAEAGRAELPTELALALGGLTTFTPSASAATVGAGSYTTTLPAGGALPTGCGDVSTRPRGNVTANAPAGAVPTNDWWSSILFKKTDCQFGEPMMAHPAGYDTYPGGLGISYSSTPVITGSATGWPAASDPG